MSKREIVVMYCEAMMNIYIFSARYSRFDHKLENYVGRGVSSVSLISNCESM